MKKYITILLVLLITQIFAQAPQKMSYQAVLRNTSNTLITNAAVGMRISILQGSATGTAVYVETQNPTTNANGLVSLEIGGGTIVTGTFAGINWANGSFFIKTETAPTGGTNYTIIGTTQLLSVPYALSAKTAESIIGNNANSIYTHYIGELFGGGIVVSVWKTSGVEHGLIASLTDLGTAYWSNVQTEIGITAKSKTDGLLNTLAIINQAGHTNSAAKLCADYSSGGYNDWYLPAAWELKDCFNSFFNRVLGDSNGIQTAFYWSSTEDETYPPYAYALHSIIGWEESMRFNNGKDHVANVRAVRRF